MKEIYKFKYLRVDKKGKTICRIDVSKLNQSEIDAKWAKLELKYPGYVSCFERSDGELPCFENK